MTNDDILKKHEDYQDWSKLLQHCDFIEGFTDFEKEKAKQAFRFLQKVLGERFLHYAFENNHPIYYQYILNTSPWTRKWIIWFADALREMKNQTNFKIILNRIKTKNNFMEGLSVLENAYKFIKADFIVSIEPNVKVFERIKKPDLCIINEDTKEELFVEVSVLGESRQARDATFTMNKIYEPLWKSIKHLHYRGRLHKALSPKHLNEIIKKVEGLIEKVKNENEFHELIIEDVIELGIAPPQDRNVLDKWSKERGFETGSFTGPPIDVNEIIRIKLKIEKKQRQLPPSHPSILVIKNYHVFLKTRDIKKTINELEEEVYKYPQLLAVVITGGYISVGDVKDTIIRKDQHEYIKKIREDSLVEQHIILLNRFCDHKISPSTITKMYNSFRKY